MSAQLRGHRKNIAKHVLSVEYEPGFWAVLLTDPERDGIHCPMSLYEGLDSAAAAELAREDVIENLSDPCHERPYGPRVTAEDFNRIAREGRAAS